MAQMNKKRTPYISPKMKVVKLHPHVPLMDISGGYLNWNKEEKEYFA